MHSFAHHHHGESGEIQPGETRGLVMDWGWRYDLMVWFLDAVVLRGNPIQDVEVLMHWIKANNVAVR